MALPQADERNFQQRLIGLQRNGSAVGYQGRKNREKIYFSFAFLCLGVIITPALWIVSGVIAKAVPHFSFTVFSQVGVGLGGGLKNEIAGTLLIIFGVVIFAGFTGVLSGIFLANYASRGVGSLLRGASEVLAGIPSIVLGYVGYIALVVHFHWGFSLGAGLITLSIMVLPYIAKTTEVALRQVPTSYTEGAEALGLREGFIMRRILLRSALPTISTGIIVATAIALGETAPLLYTAGFSNDLPHLAFTHSPLGYLTYAVWAFYNQPSTTAQQLSYDAALLLVFGVILLIVTSRILVSRTQKYSEARR